MTSCQFCVDRQDLYQMNNINGHTIYSHYLVWSENSLTFDTTLIHNESQISFCDKPLEQKGVLNF